MLSPETQWSVDEIKFIQKLIQGEDRNKFLGDFANQIVKDFLIHRMDEDDIKIILLYLSSIDYSDLISKKRNADEAAQLAYNNTIIPCDKCGKSQKRFQLINKLIDYRSQYWCQQCIDDEIERRKSICSVCGEKTFCTSVKSIHLCESCRNDFNTREAKRVTSQNNRTRQLNLPSTLTLREWLDILDDFGGKCSYCKDRDFEVMEHKYPVCKGGGTTADNVVPACYRCNIIKGKSDGSIITLQTSYLSH